MIFVLVFLLYLSVSNANNVNDDIGTWKLFVNERFLALEHKVDVFQQQLKDALQDNIRLRNDNSMLRRNVKTLENRVKNLANENTGHMKEGETKVKELEKRLDRLITRKYSDRFDSEKQTAERNSNEIQKENNHQIEGKVRRIVPPTSSPQIDVIAFYCYMTSSISAVQSNHILQFDIVPTNKGNAYNKDDGIFTVPTSGVYVFSWTVPVGSYSCAYTEIVVNGHILGKITPDSAAQSGYDTPTGIVVVEGNTGQHVFVRLSRTCKGQIVNNNNVKTSFAGWLL